MTRLVCEIYTPMNKKKKEKKKEVADNSCNFLKLKLKNPKNSHNLK